MLDCHKNIYYESYTNLRNTIIKIINDLLQNNDCKKYDNNKNNDVSIVIKKDTYMISVKDWYIYDSIRLLKEYVAKPIVYYYKKIDIDIGIESNVVFDEKTIFIPITEVLTFTFKRVNVF